MRQVLIDHARKKNAEKRGGTVPEVPVDQVALYQEKNPTELIALDDALDRLAQRDERSAKVVECRFFGSYTIQETGPTVKLLDFGIAKLLDDSLPVTRPEPRTGPHLMTPSYAAADTTYQKALAMMKALYQPGHPEVLSTLSNLANARHEQDRLASADSLIRKALTLH